MKVITIGARTKKILISIFSILFVLMIALSVRVNLINAMALENPSMTMRVSQESESVGNTVNVRISLENNPGIASIRVQVSYDDFLTLENVEFNSALGGQAQTSDYLNNGSPITLIWVNAFSNFTEDGLFATLCFRINDNAVEETFSEISVTYNASDIYNADEQDVYLNVINGSVYVQSCVAGDINGDGNVNNKDVTRLFQYLADWDVDIEEAALDVNGDGVVNNKDITRLFQYLADWDVKIYVRRPFIVIFNGNGGTLVSGKESQVIKSGESAVAPVYEREGYVFDDFDADYTNISCDMTITALWKESTLTLETPAITNIENDVIKWTAVENATSYTVKVTDAKELQYTYEAKDAATACSITDLKKDGQSIPTSNYGFISVQVKANANGKYGASEWSEKDSNYYYIPDTIINDEIRNLYIGYGYNLNEWDYLNLDPLDHTFSSVLNLGKLLTICDVVNPNVSSGFGQSYYYETLDEYIEKSKASLSFGGSFADKAGKLLGLYLKASGSGEVSQGTRTYNKNITLKTEYCVRSKAYDLSNLDRNLLKYCFTSSFLNDISMTANESTDEYCSRIYEKYGTIAILGVITGGVRGYNYTVSTDSKEIYTNVKSAFEISVGVDIQKLVNAEFNIGCSAEELTQNNSSTTKATLEEAFRGGEIKIKSSGANSDTSEWSIDAGSALPIELTNNGAIAISSLIAFYNPVLAQRFEEYVLQRTNKLCEDLYQKYVDKSTLPMNLESDGILRIDLSAFEGTNLYNAECPYLNGDLLTIYPTYCGKDIKQIKVVGSFDDTRCTVDGFVIHLVGWKNDVKVIIENVGVKCSSKYGIIDYSKLPNSVKVDTDYRGINYFKTTSDLKKIIAKLNDELYTFVLDAIDENIEFDTLRFNEIGVKFPLVNKEGYDFIGWFDAEGNQLTDAVGNIINTYTFVADSSLTIHPEFTSKVYTIELDHQGADRYDHSYIYEKYGDKFYLDKECLNFASDISFIPVRTGYIFGGYYLNVRNNGSSDAYGDYEVINSAGIIVSSSFDFSANEIIMAKWIPIVYEIALIAEDCTGDYTHVLYEKYGNGFYIDKDCSLGISDIKLPKKTGYSFKGYYLEGICVIDSSGEMQVDTHFVKEDNVTLEAVFSVDDYSVTLDSNGGEIKNGDITGYTYGEEKYLPQAVVKIGYIFRGWYDNEENDNGCGNLITHISSTDSGNKTYYAKWEIEEYIISYDLNGGEFSTTQIPNKYTYGETAIDLPVDVTRVGYIFEGWYGAEENNNGYGTKITQIATNHVGDVTYYAKWTPISYAIDYELNKGTIDSQYETNIQYDEVFTVDNPTRTGYIFNGWTISGLDGCEHLYGDSIESMQSTTDGALTGIKSTMFKNLSAADGSIIVFTAIWTPITYKVFPADGYGVKSGLEPINCKYDVSFKISWSNTFTGESGNFNFKGWYSDSSYSKLLSTDATATLSNLTTVDGSTVYVYAKAEVKDSSCFTGDTLVTLADGSSTRLDSLKVGDIILSWNAITGEFESKAISMYWNHGDRLYDVISLTFSNGKMLKVVTEHGFFDATLNKYVYIDASNYNDYIGHEFACLNGNGVFEKVTLVAADYKKEMSSCYSLRTACNDNAIIDGFLTLTHEDIPGFLTYFEFGEGYMYDKVKMQEDIAKYGLYTYDDWKEYVSYEEFVALNGQYLTIVIGKGYLTYEDILGLIEGMR